MDNVKPFLTIREACNYTGLSQHFLRDGCKAGWIPHVKSGNIYMINIRLLLETMDDMSRENLVKEKTDPAPLYCNTRERVR